MQQTRLSTIVVRRFASFFLSPCLLAPCAFQTLSAQPQPAPTISSRAASNGAVIVSIPTPGSTAKIRYTVDGSAPTATSPLYHAPFLVASNLTVKAYATAEGQKDSPVTSKAFTLNIPPGTLVWADEFSNSTGANLQPDPSTWTWVTGNSGFGNHELENYCAWASTTPPCDPDQPNAYVAPDGLLHIVARKTATGAYTSARMKSQGLFSLQYGRLEARIWAPAAQGLWPAFWTLGNHIATDGWPRSGEQDIMERVNASLTPDWNEGSIHGPGFVGDVGLGTKFYFPKGQNVAAWHTYGITWKKDSIAFYVDDPTKPYVTYTNPESLKPLPGATWPFDTGDSAFLLLNLAVGGDWPKSPDPTTTFPSELKVDYIRIYTN